MNMTKNILQLNIIALNSKQHSSADAHIFVIALDMRCGCCSSHPSTFQTVT